MNAWLLNAAVLWCRCWCWCYYYLFETKKVNGNEENFKYWFWFWLLSVSDCQPEFNYHSEESHKSHRAHSQHLIRRFCKLQDIVLFIIIDKHQIFQFPIDSMSIVRSSDGILWEKHKHKLFVLATKNRKHTIGQVDTSRSTTMSSRHYLLKLCWIIHFKCFFRY